MYYYGKQKSKLTLPHEQQQQLLHPKIFRPLLTLIHQYHSLMRITITIIWFTTF